MRVPRPFPFNQARQRKHDRHAGDDNEQREDEVVELESLPWNVIELKPKEMADPVHDRPLAGAHVVKRPDGAVAAENPEDVEPAQRVDRRNSPRRRNGHDLDETLRRQLQLHVRGSFEGRSKHWDRSRARLAVGGGFPFLLFRLQVGFTVPPWLTFPGAPYNPGRPDFPGPV